MTSGAASASLLGCHYCGLLSRAPAPPRGCENRCPRCNAPLHERKYNGIGRTWAFLLAAAILYVPANVFPVMTVVYFGEGSPDTIMSGVKYLFASGQVPVALLVFFASVVVPMLKILVLTYLLLSVQLGWRWRPKDRTVLYRLVEIVGRWSMLDIFMISILVALVKLQAVATIEAGIGATAFAAVVVLTMFAAWSFDPRLIWDRMEDER